MSVHLLWPNTMLEFRHIRIDCYRPGTSRTRKFELVADQDHASVLTACDISGWLEVSTDDGGTWHALGTNVLSGYEVGPLTKGVRKEILLKLTAPVDAQFRNKLIALKFGEGD